MKRLISLMLAILLVASVSFAGDYDEPGLTGGQHLQKYGIVEGEYGNLNEQNSLTRDQLATLISRLYGLEAEAKNYSVPSGYKDEAKFGWAKGYISYAKMKGWMQGSHGVFDNKGKVTGEQLATVLLRILNRPEKWGTNIGRMGALGVIIPNKQLTRGQTFDAIWSSFSQPIMADGSILGVNLNKLPEIDKTPATLEILAVETPSLSRVVVKFNQEPNQTSANNISIAGATVSNVQKNGETFVIDLAPALVNQKEYTLKLENIAAMSPKVPMLSTEKKFTALDTTMPQVEGVAFSGPKHLSIQFTENIKTVGKIEIKQGNVTVNVNQSKTLASGANVTTEAFTNFVEGKEYTITITDFKDEANFPNKNHTVSLVYQKDINPPVVKSMHATNEVVNVVFSKPVKGSALTNFAHSFANYHPVTITAMDGTAYNAANFYNGLRLVFFAGNPGDKPLPSGSVKVMVKGKSSGGNIVDAWGNILADTEMSVDVKGENTPLTANVTVVNGEEISVEFNKEVKAPVPADFVIKKANGAVVPFTIKKHTDKKFSLELSTSVTSETLTVEIVKAVDTSAFASELKNYKVSLAFGDTEAPGISTVVAEPVMDGLKEIARDLIITYVTDDLSSDAIAGKYYKLSNGANFYNLDAMTGEFVGGNRTVRFRFPKDTTDPAVYAVVKDNLINSVLAGDVKDNSGNVMPTRSYVISAPGILDLDVAFVETFDMYKGAKREGVMLQMTENVVSFNDYSGILFNLVGLKVDSVEFEGSKVYLLTSGAEIPKNAGFTITVPADIFVSELGRGNGATIALLVTDKINPSAEYIPVDSNELNIQYIAPKKFKIFFDEELNNTASINDFFALALKIKHISGGVTKELVPGVDYKVVFDGVWKRSFEINLQAGVVPVKDDEFVFECVDTDHVTDIHNNPLRFKAGSNKTVVYP